jgi:hypothetical protein
MGGKLVMFDGVMKAARPTAFTLVYYVTMLLIGDYREPLFI